MRRSPPLAPFAILAGLLAGAFAIPGAARAQDEGALDLADPAAAPAPETALPADEASWLGVELLGGTTAPIDAHVGARLVFFDHLFVSGSLGPTPYGGMLGSIARGAGSDQIGTVITELAGEGLALNARAGLMPWGTGGIELVVGFTHLGGSSTLDVATLAGALGMPAGASGTLEAGWGIDALHFEIGWTMSILDTVLIRPALGWFDVIDSRTTLDAGASASPQMREALDEGEVAIDDAVREYGMAPTISLDVGLRF
jgi:hypothetical protein